MHQRVQKPLEELVEVARLQLDAEQLVKGLRFGLADLIIGVVQREDDSEVKLFAYPLEIGVLIRHQGRQHRRQQAVVFLERR